jgi:hypothetical protein
MKKILFTAVTLIFLISFTKAQQKQPIEKYGNTLNLGIGLGYYGYIGHVTPLLRVDYEFDVAKNLTLAPFIACYSYSSRHYWGNPHYPYRDYSYRVLVIPVGVKGTYYFDGLLNAGGAWDFYLAGSAGFSFRQISWENEYQGETGMVSASPRVFVDVHIGAEYHLNSKIGLFLDLSTGISTVGLAVHF